MANRTQSSLVRILYWLPAVMLFLAAPVWAEVIPYPQIPGRSLSSTYTLTVDGQTVPVQQYNGRSFAWFAFSGTVNVKVTVNQNVSSYRLSPTRNQVPSTASGRDIMFALSQPRKLVLHKVNGLTEQLFIFADAVESNPPKLGSAGVFNAQGYGADPNGVNNSANAINQAINAASAYPGGGVAYVPPGTYNVTGSIVLKNNSHLYLAAGATIRLQPGTYTSQTGFPVSQVSNAKISGRGVIYGRGSEGSSNYQHVLHTDRAVNFSIQDVMFLDGRTTAVRLAMSTDCTVDNAKILSGSPSLSDGIDLESNTRVTISNNFIYSSDDNIAIGSGTNIFQYTVPGPTDTISITGNVFSHPNTGYSAYGHLVSIVPWRGTTHIRNIKFDNNDAIWQHDVFSIYPFGGTNVEAVTYSNSAVEEVTGKHFDFWAGDCSSWGVQNCGQPMGVVGYIHNIQVTNVTIANFGAAWSVFQGYSSTSDVNGVTFSNLSIAKNLILDAASARFNIVPPYVRNLTFTGVADKTPPQAPTGVRIE